MVFIPRQKSLPQEHLDALLEGHIYGHLLFANQLGLKELEGLPFDDFDDFDDFDNPPHDRRPRQGRGRRPRVLFRGQPALAPNNPPGRGRAARMVSLSELVLCHVLTCTYLGCSARCGGRAHRSRTGSTSTVYADSTPHVPQERPGHRDEELQRVCDAVDAVDDVVSGGASTLVSFTAEAYAAPRS